MIKTVLLATVLSASSLYAEASDVAEIYGIGITTIDGRKTSMDTYRDKVILIVNVASECGFTPQYDGLERLFQKYKDKGFMVLGFPCNQFGAQEPGSEQDILNFCRLNYGVTFPLFAKIEVNGENAHPLFRYLKKKQPGGSPDGAIKWNFTKFLVDKDGTVVQRYPSATSPEELTEDIEQLL
ncbi:MAG: glutathione peroxidase [Desulfopila sp.]|jgi:glutathione peroxidase|nr:glutathione peroxidase [Desulfopila sp.]